MNAILLEIRSLDLSRPALRRFGLTVGFVFLLIALFLTYRNHWQPAAGAWTTAAVGATLVLGGLVVPMWLRPVYRFWMGVAFAMGFVMTRVLLSLVFFLLVTPTGVVRRLLGHDPMGRRPGVTATTFWIARDDTASDRERMTRAW